MSRPPGVDGGSQDGAEQEQQSQTDGDVLSATFIPQKSNGTLAISNYKQSLWFSDIFDVQESSVSMYDRWKIGIHRLVENSYVQGFFVFLILLDVAVSIYTIAEWGWSPSDCMDSALAETKFQRIRID